MNESLSPSINTSTTNKPRRTSNKPKKNQINLEDDDNISMASSLGENAKEPEMTPRRTTIPKRQRSISSPTLCSDVKSLDNEATLETIMQSLSELQFNVTEFSDQVTKIVEYQETVKGQATLLSKNPI